MTVGGLRPRLAVAGAIALLAGLAIVAPAAKASGRPAITGVVVDSAGHPVVGAEVKIIDIPITGLWLFGCINPVSVITDACTANTYSARTDSRGRYRLTPGKRFSAYLGDRRIYVTGPRSSAGPATPTFDGFLLAHSAPATLPTVRLWTKAATYTRSGGRTRFTLLRPPGGSGKATLTLRGDVGDDVAYPLELKKDRAEVDDRVVETGTRGVDGSVEGQWVHGGATWTSSSTAVATAGTPASRTRGCATYAAGGALVDFAGCPFTDGHLSTSLSVQQVKAFERGRRICHYSSECDSPNAVIVDLAKPLLLNAVVWRACYRCELEVSLEGTLWTPWPRVTQEGDAFAVLTGDPIPVRYVRVVGQAWTYNLQELSVWGAPLLPGLGLPGQIG